MSDGSAPLPNWTIRLWLPKNPQAPRNKAADITGEQPVAETHWTGPLANAGRKLLPPYRTSHVPSAGTSTCLGGFSKSDGRCQQPLGFAYRSGITNFHRTIGETHPAAPRIGPRRRGYVTPPLPRKSARRPEPPASAHPRSLEAVLQRKLHGSRIVDRLVQGSQAGGAGRRRLTVGRSNHGSGGREEVRVVR